MITLEQLNAGDQSDFVAAIGDVFEHAPWVAGRAYAARPFGSVAALHDAMMRAVRAAPRDQQLAFLRGHPELAGKVARAGAMTADSKSEQGGLGLDRLSDADFARFEHVNAAYAKKFGFPFIVCVRLHKSAQSILAAFEQRVGNDPETEFSAALAEIAHITRLRLEDRVKSWGEGEPRGYASQAWRGSEWLRTWLTRS